ncbi:MAG: hypothetical protein HY292_18865 [Planctomycetes bacterium]|nr:hypothetical protein [Planctomycetota bacterium]
MTAIEILAELTELGAVVQKVDNRLRVVAPGGVLTDAIKADLRTHKDEILRALAPPTTTTRGPESAPSPEPSDAHLPPDWRTHCVRLLGAWFGTVAEVDLDVDVTPMPRPEVEGGVTVEWTPIRMPAATIAIFEAWERRFPNRRSTESVPNQRREPDYELPPPRIRLQRHPEWDIPDSARRIMESFFLRWFGGDGARELPADVTNWPPEYRAALSALAARHGSDDEHRRSAEETIRRFVRTHDRSTVFLRRGAHDDIGSRHVMQREAVRTSPPTGTPAPPSCPCCKPGEPVGRIWWSRPRPAETFGVFTEEDLNAIARNLKADDRVVARRLGPDPLPIDPNEWPEPWRADFDRRVECMVTEGGLTHDEAVRKVEPFIRRWGREEAAGVDNAHRLLADQVGSCGTPDEPQRPFTPDALDPVTPVNSPTTTKGADSDVAVS